MGKKKRTEWSGVSVPKRDAYEESLSIFESEASISAFIAGLKASGKIKDPDAVYTSEPEEGAPGQRLSKPLGDILNGSGAVRGVPTNQIPQRVTSPHLKARSAVKPADNTVPGKSFRLYVRGLKNIDGIAVCDQKGNGVGLFPRAGIWEGDVAQRKNMTYDLYVLAKLHMGPDAIMSDEQFKEMLLSTQSYDSDSTLVFRTADGKLALYIIDYDFATGEFFTSLESYMDDPNRIVTALLDSPLMAPNLQFDYDEGSMIYKGIRVPYSHILNTDNAHSSVEEYLRAMNFPSPVDDGELNLNDFIDDPEEIVNGILRDIASTIDVGYTDPSSDLDDGGGAGAYTPYEEVIESGGASNDNTPFCHETLDGAGATESGTVPNGEPHGTGTSNDSVSEADEPVGQRFLNRTRRDGTTRRDQPSGGGETLGDVLKRSGITVPSTDGDGQSASGGDLGSGSQNPEGRQKAPETGAEGSAVHGDRKLETKEGKSVPEGKEKEKGKEEGVGSDLQIEIRTLGRA